MNFQTILIESIVLIILFTIVIVSGARDPLNVIYSMPKPLIKRCLELGLINEERNNTNKQTKIKKLFVALFFVAVLVLLLYFVNHVRTFKDGFCTSYILWLVVDWYDCFILDWGWACHSKHFIIPGTEDLMDSYKDYKFHFMGSVKGMFIGLPVCILVGIFLQIFSSLL